MQPGAAGNASICCQATAAVAEVASPPSPPPPPHLPGGAAHTHLQAGASRGAEVLVQGHVGPAKQVREGPGPTRKNWEGAKFGAKKGAKDKVMFSSLLLVFKTDRVSLKSQCS